MKQWLSEYGYLLWILLAAVAVMVIIFYFAARAYSAHSKQFKAQEGEMRRLLALKEKYFDFTENTLRENDICELLEGVALSYQIRLQRQDNPEEAFGIMSEEKKNIYALDVFCADKDIKVFFSENGDIVKDRIITALEMIGMPDFACSLRPVCAMYDQSNEEVSYSLNDIDKLNSLIEQQDILTKIKLHSGEYIRNNFDVLKN